MPHKLDLKTEILSRIDFAGFYAKHTKDLKHTTGDNFLGKCPFHDDSTASFAVNLKNGLWQCKTGCGQGDVFHYAGKLCNLNTETNFREILNYTANEIGITITAEVPKSNIQKVKNPKKPDTSNEDSVKCAEPLPQTLVDKFRSNLTPELKHKLAQKRGLNECTLDRFEVGYCSEKQRYTIPVRNEKGDIVTIRLYDPDPKAWAKMINYVEKRGDKVYTWTDKSQLLGLKDLIPANPQRIIICEGEFDCMMLWEKGFPAITGVTGANSWDKEWEKHLKDKDVVLLYDSDKPGKDNSLKHGTRLKAKSIAKTVKIATLPLPGDKNDKDVTDWFAKDGKAAEELQALIDAAVEPPDGPSGHEEPEPPEPSENSGDGDRPPPDDGDDPGEQYYDENPWKPDDIENKACPADVADDFLNSNNCKDQTGNILVRYWRESYWRFDETKFRRITSRDIRNLVMDFIKENYSKKKSNTSFTNDVVANMGSTMDLSDEVETPMINLHKKFPDHAIGLVSMKNGLLDFGKIVRNEPFDIEPHSPGVFILNSLPFGYNQDAQCQTWERFLSEVIPEEEVRLLLQEYCGYMLASNLESNLQRFLFCIGTGRNGKSVFLSVIREMLGGSDNVSSVSLSEFGDKFKIASMAYKIANISGEMGDIDKIPEERLKAIVGGDQISIEEKYKNPYDAVLPNKLIFASNHIPNFRDRTLGLLRKMLVIRFDVTITEQSQDRTLADRIIRDELPGVFNWSIRGLRRLLDRGDFSEPPSCADAKEELSREINPAKRFLLENFVLSDNNIVNTQEIYNEYREYCKGEGLTFPLSQSKFGGEVKNIFGNTVEKVQRRLPTTGARIRCYLNIKRKDDIDDPPSYEPVDHER